MPVLFFSFGGGIVAAAFFQAFESKSPEPAETRYRYEPVSYPIEVPKNEPEIPVEYNDLPDYPNMVDLKIKLIDVGQQYDSYRKEEVIAKNGEKWLGLFDENGKTYLREVSTKVKLDLTSTARSEDHWVRLTTNHNRVPWMLLKNARRLNSGPVETVYLGPSWSESESRGLNSKEMKLGFNEDFSLGEINYTLRVATGRTKNGDKASVLVLEAKSDRQVVVYNQYSASASYDHSTLGYLHWAGDLDRDGKLDLYIEHYGFEKGGFSSSLYLSSEAGESNFVKEAAWFGTAGC